MELKDNLTDVELFVSVSNENVTNLVKDVSQIANLDSELANSSIDPVPQSVQTCTNFNDKLLYIFTSGTTGLPKAAVIKNSRYANLLRAGLWNQH